jgi:hypothetical protein
VLYALAHLKSYHKRIKFQRENCSAGVEAGALTPLFALMNARETASKLAPSEFIALASYLDRTYSERAAKFDVQSVHRTPEGLLISVTVELLDETVVGVTSFKLSKQRKHHDAEDLGAA